MKLLWFTNTPSLATEKLTGTFGIGGGWLESLEKHFRAQTDAEVAVAFYWDGTESIMRFTEEGREYFAIPSPNRGGKLEKFKRRSKGLIEGPEYIDYFEEIVKEYKPDLIHVFGSEKAFGLVASRVKIPTVIWIQGNLTVYTHKWFAGISKEEVLKHTPQKQKIKSTDMVSRYRMYLNLAERERDIFRGCRYYTGRTDWDRRVASVLSPGSSYFHCEEILRDAFYQVDWQPHEGRKELRLMTTVQGNLYKGMETIIEVMQLFRKLNNKVRWRVCGLKEGDGLIQLLEKKYKVNFASLGIDLLGKVNSETLINELIEADIFVHPSHIDNSPNSVCEAMLVGTPVLATYAGGTPSLLENNQEGLLVQPGDPYAMAGAIMDLQQRPDIAAQMAQAAKARAQQRQNPEQIVQSLMDIYQHILEKENAPKKVDTLSM